MGFRVDGLGLRVCRALQGFSTIFVGVSGGLMKISKRLCRALQGFRKGECKQSMRVLQGVGASGFA